MAAAALSVLAFVTVVLVLIWAGQRSLMYFPSAGVPSPSSVGLPEAEPVTFVTADGVTLHAWFVPGRRFPAQFTVLVFNGNAGNRAYRAPLAAALGANGLSVLLLDYRGYGENAGTPSERGLAADARAARAYLARRSDVDASRIVYFGESLGSAVATGLAAEHPPAALILRSPFASMAEVGQFHYPLLPVRRLLRDRYAAIDRIQQVRSPLLVIAGSRDTIVPLEQSRRLYDAAPSPKTLVIVEGADHNDLELLAGEQMIRAIVGFVGKTGPGAGG